MVLRRLQHPRSLHRHAATNSQAANRCKLFLRRQHRACCTAHLAVRAPPTKVPASEASDLHILGGCILPNRRLLGIFTWQGSATRPVRQPLAGACTLSPTAPPDQAPHAVPRQHHFALAPSGKRNQAWYNEKAGGRRRRTNTG